MPKPKKIKPKAIKPAAKASVKPAVDPWQAMQAENTRKAREAEKQAAIRNEAEMERRAERTRLARMGKLKGP